MATHFEATLKCQYCARKFRDKCTLMKHERTHTGIKHYQCHICEHAFNQCTPFYVHMEKKHDIERDKIKAVMNIISEGCKRAGKKVELYRVPDNVEEWLAELEQEELRIASRGSVGSLVTCRLPVPRVTAEMLDHVVYRPKQQYMTSRKPFRKMKSVKVEEAPAGMGATEAHQEAARTLTDLEQHSLVHTSVTSQSGMMSDHKTVSTGAQYPVHEYVLLDQKSVLLPEATTTNPQLLNLDNQNRHIVTSEGHLHLVTADNQVPVYSSMQPLHMDPATAQTPMHDETLKHKPYTMQAGYPKQKMKLLTQYQQNYEPTRDSTPAPGDLGVEHGAMSKPQQVPVYHLGQQAHGVDTLTEAYTADFLERILQGQ